jgi:hypothetical protein
MRTALVVTFAVILFSGCKSSDSCSGACETTDAKYGIGDRTILAVDQRAFAAYDGLDYTLVRIEYGSESVYCGFTVGGEEYPVYADFQTDEDVLFDADEDLTGLDLPIFDDEDFDTWLWETDVDDDILIACFD